MEREKSYTIFTFFHNTFFSFGIFVLFVTLVVIITTPEQPTAGMLALAPDGLSGIVILQFFLTTLCCNIVTAIFSSQLIFKKMPALWRSIFSALGSLVITSMMVVLFDWFPQNDQWAGWVGLIITFTAFTAGGIVIMLLKTHYESKKYQKILDNFKERKEDRKVE